MDIIFLQNSATQPRCHKRFRTLRKIGINGVVYSFNRNLYNVNIPNDIPTNLLGDIVSGATIKRLGFYIRKLRPIFQQNKGSIFYCYGQDMALVAALFNVKFIYEESDLVYLMYSNQLRRRLMRKIDLWLQKKSLATVLTSQGFVNYLYQDQPKNVFVIPNKLDTYFLSVPRPKSKFYDSEKLRFAFIGLLRYERTITAFVKTMTKYSSKYEFHIWGDGAEKQKEFVRKLSSQYPKQVFYHGPFRNPMDLNYIYSQVDVNFVCYDTNGLNERIAEPNKLYESTYFNTPILVSPNTYLSSVVEKWDTGFIVDCLHNESIGTFFQNINIYELSKKSSNCAKIEEESLIDSEIQTKMIIDYITQSTNIGV